jgi:hypothetical protein
MGYCDIIHCYCNNNGNLFFKKRLENKMILDQIVENYPDEEILKADGLDDGIIGIEENSMRLVYSKSKVIEILMSEDMTEEDALEHYYFNIVGAYVGEKTPIFVEDTYI